MSIGPAGDEAESPEERGRVVVAEVTRHELDGAGLLRDLASAEDGALVLFEGRVRNHNSGRAVARLHYDAYTELADRVLTEIAREAADQFGASAVGIRHRTGTLVPGEVSLVVAVLAAHRAQAFDASRYVIEQLKKRVPIWKKEDYLDGTSEWLGEPSPGTVPEEGDGS